ncbi:MAG: nucleotidyltransferase [Zestosphaera tikiterensis]|uniref:Nucleotidyltransferase n=1 Tax=Zestosphaera tikiterensis TaxID=1973259 RepID=A0A2R7Y410_9CREN|nr:MAG: nucleotidyltransferase [Zestosphaera tikiterensis]
MKAAIIAGGLGRRLRPLTSDRPKPLVEVGGKPIIQWQIEWLRSYGVDTVVVLAGYHREKLVDFLGSGGRFGVTAVYVVEEEPLGTGGALKNAENILKNDEVFIAVNGDIITDIPINELVEELEGVDEALGVLALVPLKSPYGIVELGSNNRVVSFREKPIIPNYLINAGVYALKPEVFKHLPKKGDLEKDTFPKLASQGRLLGKVFLNSYWRSIDTLKDVEEAGEELIKSKLKEV